VERIIAAQPLLIDVALHAREVWPDMGRTLLHAGAPIAWDRMCGPMRGAMIGALLYEQWADTPESAAAMLGRGDIRFAQCHDFGAVGPMAGVISPSMPLFVVRNQSHGNMAYSNMSEGIGDEVHSRNAAATLQFLAAIAVPLADAASNHEAVRATLEFIAGNSQFFLNLSMASSKAIMDSAHGIDASSIVTAMARNGVTTAIRVSGLAGQWFEAPSDTPVGLYFPGFAATDANADLGDSAICETAGFGGFSLAASPALVQLVGGSVAESIAYSREMYEITAARNPALSLPNLDFAGSPCGIDVRKVVDNNIRPVVTTGIAHRDAGVGQIGAGIVRPPMDCFTKALLALARKG
jgi:hypothetical protein